MKEDVTWVSQTLASSLAVVLREDPRFLDELVVLDCKLFRLIQVRILRKRTSCKAGHDFSVEFQNVVTLFWVLGWDCHG